MAAEIVNDNSDVELGSLRGVTREELLHRLRDGDQKWNDTEKIYMALRMSGVME